MRERIKEFEILDRHGESVKLTEAKWGRFVRLLAGFEGWSSRLRADFGGAADFLVKHRLIELDGAVGKDFGKALAAVGENGYALELEDAAEEAFRVKVIEKETSALQRVESRASCSTRGSTRACATRTRSSPTSSACRPSRSRTTRSPGPRDIPGAAPRGARPGKGRHPAVAFQGPR